MRTHKSHAHRHNGRDKRRGKALLNENIAQSLGVALTPQDCDTTDYNAERDKSLYDNQAVAIEDLHRAREMGITLYCHSDRNAQDTDRPDVKNDTSRDDHDAGFDNLNLIADNPLNDYKTHLQAKETMRLSREAPKRPPVRPAVAIAVRNDLDEIAMNDCGITLYECRGNRIVFSSPHEYIAGTKEALKSQAIATNDAHTAKKWGIHLYSPNGHAVRLDTIAPIDNGPAAAQKTGDPVATTTSKHYKLRKNDVYDPTRTRISPEDAARASALFRAKVDARDETELNKLGISMVATTDGKIGIISPRQYLPAKASDRVLQAEAANDAQLARRLGISLYGVDGSGSDPTPLDRISSIERTLYAEGIRTKNVQAFSSYIADHRIPVDDKMACLLGYVRAAQKNDQLDKAFTHENCATILSIIHDTSVPRDDREQIYHNGVRMLRDQLWRKPMFADAPARFLYFRQRLEKIAPDIMDHQLANL